MMRQSRWMGLALGLAMIGLGCIAIALAIPRNKDLASGVNDESSGATAVKVKQSTIVAPRSASDPELISVEEKSTHQQTRIINIAANGSNAKINAFCMNPSGEIIAACGNSPGEIRIINDDGKVIRSWKLTVKPEAIGCGEDGTVYAGGEGKLFSFTNEGKLLHEADAPHATTLRENSTAMRDEAVEYIKRKQGGSTSASALKSRLDAYTKMIESLESKKSQGELSSNDERTLQSLTKSMEPLKKQYADAQLKEEKSGSKEKGPSESEIASTIKMLTTSKMRIASISSDGKFVYAATPALRGYGFAVWRMNKSFEEGKEIVKGLSGCCGQMDVQACKNGLYVAENSRKRVVRYDSDGKQINAWGKSDRTGVDGFTSCCNPMNVCFNSKGDVFTAESNTGRIKRFSADGEFLDFVGDVKLVPGCKNVSIAVTPDHSRIYMLDLTRNHIVVMEKKSDSAPTKDSLATSN